ncbi:hypothetical protein MMC30_008691 [Trapelia coarctata]|nr:hypothetical protein [Trapelia coarctata]
MNGAPPPAPAYSTAAPGSAPLYDPLRRMSGVPPPSPLAMRPALPPGASPLNTPDYVPMLERGIPWLGPRGNGAMPAHMTSSRPSAGRPCAGSGSAHGAQTVAGPLPNSSHPSVSSAAPSIPAPVAMNPLVATLTSSNASGLGVHGGVKTASGVAATTSGPTPLTAVVLSVVAAPSGIASGMSNPFVVQAAPPTSNSPEAGAPLGQTGAGNTPTPRPLTAAEKKQKKRTRMYALGHRGEGEARKGPNRERVPGSQTQ